jgi:hypothetical protein
VPAGVGVTAANFKPTINGVTGGKEVVTDTMKRIAPKQVIIASGTLNNEHGVFFTLRSSSLTSLEGLHEFKVQFVVPATWCSNELQVNCRARGMQETLWIKRHKIWAQKSEGVTIVLAGATAHSVADAGTGSVQLVDNATLARTLLRTDGNPK